jgi:site-specific recombinase XerD
MKKKPRNGKKKSRPKRSVPLSDEALKVMEQQLEKFRQKFGRDPGPDDPVFFDAEADMPQLVD